MPKIYRRKSQREGAAQMNNKRKEIKDISNPIETTEWSEHAKAQLEKIAEEDITALAKKIINAIKENFEGMNYPEAIEASDLYDEEAMNFEAFYASIEYDIKKILRGK